MSIKSRKINGGKCLKDVRNFIRDTESTLTYMKHMSHRDPPVSPTTRQAGVDRKVLSRTMKWHPSEIRPLHRNRRLADLLETSDQPRQYRSKSRRRLGELDHAKKPRRRRRKRRHPKHPPVKVGKRLHLHRRNLQKSLRRQCLLLRLLHPLLVRRQMRDQYINHERAAKVGDHLRYEQEMSQCTGNIKVQLVMVILERLLRPSRPAVGSQLERRTYRLWRS